MIFKTLCKLYTSGRSQHKYTIYIQYIHTITYTIEYFRKDVSSKRVQIENRITRQFFDFQNLRELGKTEQRIFEFFFFSKIEPFIFYHILEKPAFVSASLPHKMSKLEVAKDTDDFDHFSFAENCLELQQEKRKCRCINFKFLVVQTLYF